VVLTIRSAAAELYALPWELLTLRVTGQHLGELPDVLLRYEWPDSTSAPSACPMNQTGRFLLAWSAAAGPVPVAEHLSALQSACRQSGLPFDAETEVVAHVSCGRLIAALDSAQKSGAAVSVLHLLCHGGEVGSTFGLSLDSDEVGAAGVVVDAGRLRQLLAPYASTLRLVVLCACESGNPGSLGNQLGSVAQTLHRAGIASVIASRYPLSVAGSIRFSQVLYEQLLVGPSSLEDALLVARRRLAEDASQLDWASLQLYARAQDGDDTRPVTFRPYRGLLAFQPEHHRFLFGRSPEVAEILADLSALSQAGRPRLLIVAGVSGTGKSSLVLGGAVPRLLEKHGGSLRLVRLRPGSQPLEVLNAMLACDPTDQRAVLLIVDQFEEVFTHVQDPALRQAFARRLWTLASEPHSASQTTVLITLRVDFIGRCGELLLDDAGLCLDRIAYDEAHRIFVSKPGPEQLRAVITEPARLVGLAIDPGLTSRILDDLGAEPGALPLLQDTLDLLWQRRQGRFLTQQAYDELGGVVGALRGHADALFDALPRPSRAWPGDSWCDWWSCGMRQISRRRLASGSPGDRSDPRAFKMQFTKTRCWHGWWMRDSWSAIRRGSSRRLRSRMKHSFAAGRDYTAGCVPTSFVWRRWQSSSCGSVAGNSTELCWSATSWSTPKQLLSTARKTWDWKPAHS
jgi:hypothetical protein